MAPPSPAPDAPPRAGLWLPASFLALVAAILFAPGLFLGESPVFRDLLVLVLPLRHHTAEALWRGEIPLWTSGIFFGAPYLANYQSAALYPPSLLAGLGPAPLGLSLYLAFHVFAGGVGTARYLERGAGIDPAAAAFGGLAFALGGFFFSLVSLANQLAAAAWLPWILLAAERSWRTRGAGAFVGLVLAVALQLLAGAPEVVVLTGLLVAGGAALRPSAGAPVARRFLLLGAAFGLAAGIAAAQLLPTAEYAGQTNRAGGLPFPEVVSESLEPVSLLQFLIPHTFEGGAPGFMPEAGIPLFWSYYAGVAPLVFALTTLASRPPPFWVVAAGVSIVFALGDHLLPFRAFHDLVPGVVGAFRYPAKLFLPAHFAVAVLAALGLARALRRPRERTIATGVALILFSIGGAVFLFVRLDPERALDVLGYRLRPGLAPDTYAFIGAQVSAKGVRLAAFALATALALQLVARARIGAGTVAAVVLLATTLDLLAVHQPALAFVPWNPAASETVVRAGERVFHYDLDADGRLAPWLGTLRIGERVDARTRQLREAGVPDLPLLDDATAVAGVDGFAPLERALFHQTLGSLPPGAALRLLAAAGTGRVVGRQPIEDPELRPVLSRDDPPLRVYDLVRAAPRSYLASRIVPAGDSLEALRTLAEPGFRPGFDVVLTGAGSGHGPVARGALEDVSFARHSVRARVTLDGPGIWVVADTWNAGWEATVDGVAAEVLVANGIFRAVSVPTGEHVVEMRYRPRSFRIGVRLSLAALLLLPVAAVFAARGNPRGRR